MNEYLNSKHVNKSISMNMFSILKKTLLLNNILFYKIKSINLNYDFIVNIYDE